MPLEIIPIVEGVTDDPNTNDEGPNGSVIVQKINELVTKSNEVETVLSTVDFDELADVVSTLTSSIAVSMVAGQDPSNELFVLNAESAASVIILRKYQGLSIALSVDDDNFKTCTILNDTDFNIPITNDSDSNLFFLVPDGQPYLRNYNHVLASRGQLTVYLADDNFWITGMIMRLSAGS